MSDGVQLTVVIPTHGRRDSLLRVLRALDEQSLPAEAFEVVVICDGDVDGSAAACRGAGTELALTLRVVVQANQGPAAARNWGVRLATAPLIVFMDDDVVPDPDLLSVHLQAHAGRDDFVAIGPLLPPRDARLTLWSSWEEDTLLRQYDAMQAGRWKCTYRQFYTGNASVRKDRILQVGGFDHAYGRAEDVELAIRLARCGMEFAFLSDAKGWHYISRSFASWLRIPFAYGSADVAIARGDSPWMLEVIAREYGCRHPAVRFLATACAGRPTLRRPVVTLLSLLVRIVNALGAPSRGYALCALLFNLCYYDGVAAALGERRALMDVLNRRETQVLSAGGA